ncbi:hypothetical protein Mmc1_0406 [Magnetococcus marinus MC-1]|uniref:Uncharacterized protein n=1 Tax=Magnetococcus marinus (strain ATCC BAA-1437 / JCM 17883 / MC-1) TaxID=156889 RepID=A0L4N9_MAGMM|nr:hypothetical protein [Magnetococcus marinus]ABK42932.1 hypothetical protein Mmc1_0406 [Magnetococcus marinus MC-1]
MILKQVGMTALLMMGMGSHGAMAADCAQLPNKMAKVRQHAQVFTQMNAETQALCWTKHPYFQELDGETCPRYQDNFAMGVARMDAVLGGIKYATTQLTAMGAYGAELTRCSAPYMVQKSHLVGQTSQLLKALQTLGVKADECREAHERLGIWCDKQVALKTMQEIQPAVPVKE